MCLKHLLSYLDGGTKAKVPREKEISLLISPKLMDNGNICCAWCVTMVMESSCFGKRKGGVSKSRVLYLYPTLLSAVSVTTDQEHKGSEGRWELFWKGPKFPGWPGSVSSVGVEGS